MTSTAFPWNDSYQGPSGPASRFTEGRSQYEWFHGNAVLVQRFRNNAYHAGRVIL
jgi:hypothetical protein